MSSLIERMTQWNVDMNAWVINKQTYFVANAAEWVGVRGSFGTCQKVSELHLKGQWLESGFYIWIWPDNNVHCTCHLFWHKTFWLKAYALDLQAMCDQLGASKAELPENSTNERKITREENRKEWTKWNETKNDNFLGYVKSETVE